MSLVRTAVRGSVSLYVDEPHGRGFEEVAYSIDGGPWQPMDRKGQGWNAQVATPAYGEGEHVIEVRATMGAGSEVVERGAFWVRNTTG